MKLPKELERLIDHKFAELESDIIDRLEDALQAAYDEGYVDGEEAASDAAE